MGIGGEDTLAGSAVATSYAQQEYSSTAFTTVDSTAAHSTYTCDPSYPPGLTYICHCVRPIFPLIKHQTHKITSIYAHTAHNQRQYRHHRLLYFYRHQDRQKMSILSVRISTLSVTLTLAAVQTVHGFWRLPCPGRTIVARIDPLAQFSRVGEHAHVVHGGNSKSPTCCNIRYILCAEGLVTISSIKGRLMVMLPCRVSLHKQVRGRNEFRVYQLCRQARSVFLLDAGLVLPARRRTNRTGQASRWPACVSIRSSSAPLS